LAQPTVPAAAPAPERAAGAVRVVAAAVACVVLVGLGAAVWLANRPARPPAHPPVARGAAQAKAPASRPAAAVPLAELLNQNPPPAPATAPTTAAIAPDTQPAGAPPTEAQATTAPTPQVAAAPEFTGPDPDELASDGEQQFDRPAATQPLAGATTQPVEAEEMAALDLGGGNIAETSLTNAPSSQPATAPTVVATTEPTTHPTTVASRRPPLRPRQLPPEALTDAQIERAIRRGGNYLIKQFNAKTLTLSLNRLPLTGLLQRDRLILQDPAGYAGLDALCVYALMHCGLALNEPELGPRGGLMGGMIDGLKRLEPGTGKHQTYARACRAAALATFNRPRDRATLNEDVGCLIAGQLGGKYGYKSATPVGRSANGPTDFQFPGLPGGYWDNSNSQYGLLGVWSAAEAGFDVPNGYWEECETHWTETQNDHNGMWGYRNAGVHPSPSMTAAGIASLFVVSNYRAAGMDPVVGREPFSPALMRGMQWLFAGDNAVTPGGLYWGYTAYGIERVGLASGFKYFGRHDWYREIARYIVQNQQPDGGWGDANEGGGSSRVGTAYALLFLARARHPVMMNKLGFDGYWANRPWDVANLTRYAGRQLERPLNWQVVPLNHPWTDWTDSPIVYIASHGPLPLGEKDFDNLRQFAEAGGLIFTHTDGGADGDGAAFDRYVEQVLARKLFPRYEMKDVPADHPVYTVAEPIKAKDRASLPLRAIQNGTRLLLVHSPTDLGAAWQSRDAKRNPAAFQLGLNLFVYAAGKRDLRNRLDATYVPELPPPPKNAKGQVNPTLGSLAVARVEYASDWDPEPYAWPRYARLFEWHTGYGLEVTPVKWRELNPALAPFAHLTGRAAYDPSDDEIAALRSYVESGGVLLIDAAGGSNAFTTSVRKTLAKAFPDHPLAPVPWDHPLLNAGPPGMSDLSKPKPRLFTIETLGASPSKMPLEMLRAGKGSVIFSKLDVISGLLGTQTWGILGYDRYYCENLMANAMFWTLDGQPGK
jgi:hypothetical protein